MLTKNLVRFSLRNGRVYPRFIDPLKQDLLEAARALTAIFEDAPGLTRDELLGRTVGIIDATPRVGVVLRGFEKLLLDRTDFETPEDDERPNFRAEVFAATSKALTVDQFESIADYDAWIQTRFGKSVERVAGQLFSDLPGQQPVLTFKPITPEMLLHRYNCALIQWLLLHSAGVKLTLTATGPTEPRKLFKHLRFHRLLAVIHNPSPGVFELDIDGPLSLFFQTKKYGMNLARFFPALLHLSQWSLTAELDLKNRRTGVLELDQSIGIQPEFELFTAYVPKEIKVFQKSFAKKASGWKIAKESRFVPLGGDHACFPDFMLKHESGSAVAIELFHRWHASQLTIRLQQIENAKKNQLILGVDHALARKPEIAAALKDSPAFARYGFKFRDIPTVNIILPILERFLSKPKKPTASKQ